jgi:hypothetical protein
MSLTIVLRLSPWPQAIPPYASPVCACPTRLDELRASLDILVPSLCHDLLHDT